MGRRPEVDYVKTAFLASVKSARDLTAAVVALPTKLGNAAVVGLHPTHKDQIVELAFMGLVSSWEEFLERTLIRYVAGAKTGNGYSPAPKFGLADNLEHAYQIVSQNMNFDPGADYLKVSDPRWVWRIADFIFDQHPYRHLQNSANLLQYATSIRNRVGHDSTKCKKDFKDTAVAFLHPANNTLPQGYTPGDLLQAAVQRHFPQQAVQQGLTHFEAYTQLYERLANLVVP